MGLIWYKTVSAKLGRRRFESCCIASAAYTAFFWKQVGTTVVRKAWLPKVSVGMRNHALVNVMPVLVPKLPLRLQGANRQE